MHVYTCVYNSFVLQIKKVVIIVDAAANAMWTFMWFVAFVYLANEWRKQGGKSSFPTSVRNCANSGVAFSFFNIFIWVRTTYNVHCMYIYTMYQCLEVLVALR